MTQIETTLADARAAMVATQLLPRGIRVNAVAPGLLPAWTSSRASIVEALKEEGAAVPAGASGS